MKVINDEQLHEMYSCSATIHLIKRRYAIGDTELAKLLGVTKQLVNRWKNSKQAFGIKSYNKIVATFPELKGRIDYGNTYFIHTQRIENGNERRNGKVR